MIERSMEGKPSMSMERAKYKIIIKTFYRIFFQRKRDDYKAFLNHCIDKWYKLGYYSPIVKMSNNKTSQYFRYSPSVDRYLGLLDNDGHLNDIDWNYICNTYLKTSESYQQSIEMYKNENDSDSNNNNNHVTNIDIE